MCDNNNNNIKKYHTFVSENNKLLPSWTKIFKIVFKLIKSFSLTLCFLAATEIYNLNLFYLYWTIIMVNNNIISSFLVIHKSQMFVYQNFILWPHKKIELNVQNLKEESFWCNYIVHLKS